MVFQLHALNIELALINLKKLLLEDSIPPDGFELFGESVNFSDISRRLGELKKSNFLITRGEIEFILASLANFNLDFLSVRVPERKYAFWDTWANIFFAQNYFVMAWIADANYEFWQNAEDLLEYSAQGMPHQHLPKKSNGLPAPLERIIVDTSNNPGRRILKNGYIEAVGSVVWLGDRFWQLIGADDFTWMSASWLKISRPIPTILRVQAADRCFDTADDPSGSIQRNLRRYLFPNAGTPR
jgi:hypothetical protein